MKKQIIVTSFMVSLLMVSAFAQDKPFVPIRGRVNVQADSARVKQIIDGCWVAVGTNKPHSI